MIVPVIGMHRSGTSALSGVLHNHGISMGCERSFKPKPLPANPKGFYENYDFRMCNDRALANLPVPYEVKSWDTEIPEFVETASITQAAMELLADWNTKFAIWGWKDPRTCLVYPMWHTCFQKLDLLAAVRPIFLFRSPAAVARSLQKRNGLPMIVGLTLWKQYNMRVLRDLESFHSSFLMLCYEDLILGSAGQTAARISAYLDVPKPELSQHIDSSLNRNGPREFVSMCEDKEAQEFAEQLYRRYLQTPPSNVGS